MGLALGRKDGTDPFDIAPICRLGLTGVAEGIVVSIPLLPGQMLADQERALTFMARAAALAGPVHAIGLGSLCAVVAGRGEALAGMVSTPVTTGGAATAWALLENTRAAVGRAGGPVAVVGSANAVGGAVAALLLADGIPVRVDHARAGRSLHGPVTTCASPEEAVAGCPVVVGAGPTGGTLDPRALAPRAIVVDVALPNTIRGRAPRGVSVLAGEAVHFPPGWYRDGWGWIYQVLAGYGPWQIFACLVEPLVLAATGRTEPYALGRRISPETVLEFGAAAAALGFRPRLARGWLEIAPRKLLK